jgi:hypothetical protein
MSDVVPGVYPTTMRTGRFGYSRIAAAPDALAKNAAQISRIKRMLWTLA